jgi:hypothetical protein
MYSRWAALCLFVRCTLTEKYYSELFSVHEQCFWASCNNRMPAGTGAEQHLSTQHIAWLDTVMPDLTLYSH